MKKLILCVLVLCGCSKTNPYYCADHPDHNCLLDGSGGMACTMSSQCTDPGSLVCDTTQSMCVQCTAAEASACSATTPVCGSDDTCRGCQAHAECISAVCLPDGSCAAESDVAYVATNGSDAGGCTHALPCATISNAVFGTAAHFIKVSGTISDNVSLNRTVTILADPSAKLSAKNVGAAFQIAVSGISVEVNDLDIGGAVGPGISLTAQSMLLLRRATVRSNSTYGINAIAGSLELDRSTVLDNTGVGINATGLDALTIRRSTITNNHAGGIGLQSTPFLIQNNFIYSNGGATVFGGIAIYQLAAQGPHDISFNTITGNFGSPAANTGIECTLLSPAPEFANNIVYANAVSGGGTQVHGTCTFAYSDIGPEGTAMGTNVNADPQFMLPTNFHIKPTSPLKDAADMNATLMNDIDGDQRPINNRRDIGADESP